MTALYELTAEYTKALDMATHVAIDREDETISDADADTLAGEVIAELHDAIEDKAENIAKFILSLEADEKAIGGEMMRLAARRKSTQRKADWLRSYLLSELQYAGLTQIKRDVLTVSVRTNNPSIKVIDEAAVPHDWCRLIPESWEVNKDGILKHIKATGELIPGVEYVANKKRLEIR
jgi:hypothetical protein